MILETRCVPIIVGIFFALLSSVFVPSVLLHLKAIVSSGHKDARVRLVNPNMHGRGTTRHVSIARYSILFYF